jgi:hypothetical protein
VLHLEHETVKIVHKHDDLDVEGNVSAIEIQAKNQTDTTQPK